MHLASPCLHRRPEPWRMHPGALLLSVVLGAGLLTSAPVGAQDAHAILERAAERYSELASFCADFSQEIQNDLLRQTTRSQGEVCQARPDRFEMRFSDPQGDRVVADGEHVWIYFPSVDDGQVFRTSFARTGGRFDLHREFLSDPGERYAPSLEGSEAGNGQRLHVLSLEPLIPSPYLRARVWVGEGDALVHRLEIVEEEGVVRHLSFSGLELNPRIPPARFRFEPPQGVQVIAR